MLGNQEARVQNGGMKTAKNRTTQVARLCVICPQTNEQESKQAKDNEARN